MAVAQHTHGLQLLGLGLGGLGVALGWDLLRVAACVVTARTKPRDADFQSAVK